MARTERPIPSREQQRNLCPPADVVAWIYWERAGLQLIDTRAEGWAAHDVLVWLPDHRRRLSWIWLDLLDVRRR